MPPHCDSLDGPVVKAARAALAASNVDLLLPYVKAESEQELSAVFALAKRAREQGGAASEVAERYLFETAVRLHRAARARPSRASSPRASMLARSSRLPSTPSRRGRPTSSSPPWSRISVTRSSIASRQCDERCRTPAPRWPRCGPPWRRCSACKCGRMACTSRLRPSRMASHATATARATAHAH